MKEYDVVVVMGASLKPDGTPSIALTRRARHGAALVNSGTAGSVLFSGGRAVKGVTEADAMLQIGLAMNLEPEQMVLESASTDTWENAHNSVAIIKQKGWQKVVLVSDDYHLSRAQLAFKAAGMIVVGSAPRMFDISAVTQMNNGLRESIAWVWYWLRMVGRF